MTAERLAAALEGAEIVDLTQTISEATPMWPGSRPVHLPTTLADDGCFMRDIALPEHTGTHVDAPAHFVDGGAAVGEIPARDLVRPLVVADVRDVVGDDADAAVGADALRAIERRDGRIAPGVVVVVRTGWDRHIDDPRRYIGGAAARCPGIDVDAAELLVDRGVTAVGIDTLGIDPGIRTDCPAHHVTLAAGVWHLEGLVGLHRVPARGAWLVVGALPLAGGSGAPARVLAIVPR